MNWLHLICYVCVHQSISLCHVNSRSGWCSLEDPPEGNLPGLGAQVREGMGVPLLLYIRALRHFRLSKLSIFFSKRNRNLCDWQLSWASGTSPTCYKNSASCCQGFSQCEWPLPFKMLWGGSEYEMQLILFSAWFSSWSKSFWTVLSWVLEVLS